MLLKNKVAIVTGGSRGIGKAIALSFAKEGASVVLVARTEGPLKEVAAEIKKLGGEAIAISADIADVSTPEKVVLATLEHFGKIDILVNVAGIITRTPFEQLSREDYLKVLDVNLNGPTFLCQAVLPHMRKQGSGKIINMTSQMARMPHPSASPSYEITKTGLTALTRHLALQYAPYGICVNAIAPGSIDTDMPKNMSPEARQNLKDKIPMKRLGEPEEVGSCAVFLASSNSNYITGATIDINGGSLMP